MGELITPNKFHLRCPACNKLYVVSSADITSETPEFDCLSCQQRFFFNFPPSDFTSIQTIAIDRQVDLQKPFRHAEEIDASVQEMHSVDFIAQEFSTSNAEMAKMASEVDSKAARSCPKCGALNDRASKECVSCHVIFEKLLGLPEDKSLRAQPSLVRKWKEVAEDFNNEDKHEAFLMSCRQLDALRFAQSKYQAMKQVLGGDSTCERMLARIDALLVVGIKSAMVAKEEKASGRPQWMKYVFIGPFATASLMIIIGALNLNHRNMIGGGFALAFCAAGLIMMIKGRISYDDFK